MEQAVDRTRSSGTAHTLPSTHREGIRGHTEFHMWTRCGLREPFLPEESPHWTLGGKRPGQEYRTVGSVSHGLGPRRKVIQFPHFGFSFMIRVY